MNLFIIIKKKYILRILSRDNKNGKNHITLSIDFSEK